MFKVGDRVFSKLFFGIGIIEEVVIGNLFEPGIHEKYLYKLKNIDPQIPRLSQYRLYKEQELKLVPEANDILKDLCSK